jgi:hypothetical protein
MLKGVFTTSLLMLVALLLPTRVFSTTVFDFDQVEPTPRKGKPGVQVEVYMEKLYGSNISVTQNTGAVRGASIYDAGDLDNSYLKVGKGKGGSSIVIHFDDNPVDSFSVDFKLFKGAKRFSILANGQLIDSQTLTKAQKKSGLSGHRTFFFDGPIHTLEFVGLKKKSFAIDNLAVDLSSDTDIAALSTSDPTDDPNDGEEPPTNGSSGLIFTGGDIPDPSALFLETDGPTVNQVAVPEPSSFLLFASGLFLAWFRSSSQRSR